MRKSVVAKIDIKAGDNIQKTDITIKRPGTGIEPKYLDYITGKRAKTGILKDQVITWDMIG